MLCQTCSAIGQAAALANWISVSSCPSRTSVFGALPMGSDRLSCANRITGFFLNRARSQLCPIMPPSASMVAVEAVKLADRFSSDTLLRHISLTTRSFGSIGHSFAVFHVDGDVVIAVVGSWLCHGGSNRLRNQVRVEDLIVLRKLRHPDLAAHPPLRDAHASAYEALDPAGQTAHVRDVLGDEVEVRHDRPAAEVHPHDGANQVPSNGGRHRHRIRLRDVLANAVVDLAEAPGPSGARPPP